MVSAAFPLRIRSAIFKRACSWNSRYFAERPAVGSVRTWSQAGLSICHAVGQVVEPRSVLGLQPASG